MTIVYVDVNTGTWGCYEDLLRIEMTDEEIEQLDEEGTDSGRVEYAKTVLHRRQREVEEMVAEAQKENPRR